MFIIIVALLGWGLYSLYDGLYAYPRHNELVDLSELHDADDEAFRIAAEAAGFRNPEREFEKKRRVDIGMQWAMLAVCVPIGLRVLLFVSVRYIRKLGADDQGVVWGSRHVPFSAITDINKAKWDTKGIAVLHYSIDGTDGTLTLDDWHYRGAADVLETVERHTGIVG